MYDVSPESCDAGAVPGVGFKLIALVLYWQSRAISIKGLYAKMAKLSYIRQINRGNELLLLKESKVRLKVILSG